MSQWTAKVEAARAKLPLRALAAQNGADVKCPVCAQASVKLFARVIESKRFTRETVDAADGVDIVRVMADNGSPRGPPRRWRG